MKIGIIDYGMGNILSVINAIEYLGFEGLIVKNQEDFPYVEKLILPGVGAFADCMNNLKAKNLINTLNKEVIENKKAILGICLGMQVMAKTGYEGGKFRGLGWLDAEVTKIDTKKKNLKIPHIGWNNINILKESFLFNNISKSASFYFVHSYQMHCNNSENIVATTFYGSEITAAIQKENIIGTQFHPEKSQSIGLKILENFILEKF